MSASDARRARRPGHRRAARFQPARSRAARSRTGRPRSRWQRLRWPVLTAALVAAIGLGVIGVALPRVGGWDVLAAPVGVGRSTAVPPGSQSPTPAPSAAPTSAAPPPTTAPPPPVLQVPGAVPSVGTGDFAFGATQGDIAGRSGTLRRYRVAVEVGADEDVEAFGEIVDRTLADPGSWTGGGQWRLQRVPDRAGHDFTVYLATAQTAYRMCQAGWVDIRIDGVPYTSCRAQGKVIINLDRWRRSVDHYVQAQVPLDVYRTYVLNHEVGHELGHGHERCPGDGEPAPVMMQQTLFLNGCVANPWPFLAGERYAGPPL
ncbi:DUF3152 domain-containing protein [Solwaraspora sp. WMMA2056]|uniref:DUF3152 domain-containing protein n=1 Tax=Solwaraspora sp. WMMA2056 TaxID=3015161 RepID=UPI00259BC2CB|nr:DUF3152 domain-containing protein [Solwaraspora sp. WMMA2056]WJK42202.1 DUF3152 domain-containing protein [Solwaraspora sp. WMMA2056]